MQIKIGSLLNGLKSKRIPLYLGLFWTLFIFPMQFFDAQPIKFFDNMIYDQLVRMNIRPHLNIPKVVVIDIDYKSIQHEGHWPWPRNKMADLINQLKHSGVVTIATDVVMDEAEVNYALGLKEKLKPLESTLTQDEQKLPILLDEISEKVDNNQILAQSLLDHNVILGYYFFNDPSIKTGVLPKSLTNPDGQLIYKNKLPLYQFSGYKGCLESFYKASTQAGAVSNIADSDGIIRHAILLPSYENKVYASASLATVMNYLLVDHLTLKTVDNELKGIQLGSVFIPTNPRGQILIPFWGEAGTLNYYSATDIIQGKINPDELQGSIAIIGSSMALLADIHPTSVASLFPGVEIVGNIVQGIIGQQLIAEYEWHTVKGGIYFLLIALFFTGFFSFFGVTALLFLALLSIVISVVVMGLLFVFNSLYVSIASILLLISLQTLSNYTYLFIMERRQKKKIHQLFGQYVPNEYVKELIESPQNSTMEGQERTMTVQFIDIRNFTTISESLDAKEVKRLLNTFFTALTEIIFSFRGTVDKYVGDMIVAFWGAPLADEDHVSHAIMSALTVEQKLPEINKKMISLNLPSVQIGIGLATGLMNVGDMGSEFRRAYTVLGDKVNIASRLQDLTKFYRVTILVNHETRVKQDQFAWRIVDKVRVRGRKTGLTIYQPLGLLLDLSEETLDELEQYHQALEEYYAHNWSSSKKKFVMLNNKSPDVYLYQMYLERIKIFEKIPPPKDWDGIYGHLEK